MARLESLNLEVASYVHCHWSSTHHQNDEWEEESTFLYDKVHLAFPVICHTVERKKHGTNLLKDKKTSCLEGYLKKNHVPNHCLDFE